MDGPYREPKPLADLIPPDRRKQKAVALVVGGMVFGILLYEGIGRLCASSTSPDVPAPPFETATTTAPTPLPLYRSGPLSQEEIESVVAAHRTAMHRTCWSGRNDIPSARVTLSLVVGANGDVVSASATGTDALVSVCIEGLSRSWMFPAHGERSAPIKIPIAFERANDPL